MKQPFLFVIALLLIYSRILAGAHSYYFPLKDEKAQSNVPFFQGQILTDPPSAKSKIKIPTEQQKTELTKTMHGNGMRFTPNKGQIVDMDGKLCLDVLYKGSGKAADVYLRKTGISYVYTNMGEIMHEVNEQVEDLIKAGTLKEVEEQKKKQELLQKETFKIHRVDMDFEGCNKNINTINEDRLDGYQNFYYAHCPDGVANVNQYNKVTYKNIYNNIDVSYYGSAENGIKYDLIVHPSADPNQIKLHWKGVEKITLEKGKLKIKTSVNEFYESIPKVYQNINGEIIDIKAEYILTDISLRGAEAQVSFKLGTYNNKYPLIIDPWATYYGEVNNDASTSIATDNIGNVLITGYTYSLNFPATVGAFQTVYAGGWADAFVVKFDSSGTRLWATFYGGGGGEVANAIAADIIGNILITGYTQSGNFPVTVGATQPAFGGGFEPDAFVVKLNSGGTAVWSTYYGGSAWDAGHGITTDNAGNVLITGKTTSANFSITAGAFQTTYGGAGAYNFGDAFVVKLDSVGIPIWSTFYGGSADEEGGGITTDNADNILITGRSSSTNFSVTAGAFQTVLGGDFDAIVVKFNPLGTPIWSTFYGGNDVDGGMDITTDILDNVIITGYTASVNFPITAGAVQTTYGGGDDDAMVVKFNSSGSRQWATFYGEGDDDLGFSVITIADNSIFLLMETEEAATPSLIDPCAYQSVFNGGSNTNPNGGEVEDQLIVKFTPAGQKICATYVGGTGEDDLDQSESGGGCIAIDGNSLYITGTSDGGYPVTAGAFQSVFAGGWYDAFVISLCTSICEGKVLNLNFSANTTSVCENTPVTFTPSIANSCDTSGYKFHWVFTGGIPASSDSVKPTVVFTGIGTHDVQLVVTTLCKKDSITKPAYITVNPSPVISINPITICAGSTGTVTATGGTSYVWSTSETSTSISVTLTTATTYTVTGNNGGCIGTATVEVTVNPLPIVGIAGTTTICNGNSSTLTASGGIVYSWSTGETTTAITINPTSSTTYSVTGNDGSCSNTASQTVNVPTSTITGTTNICIGSSTVLTAVGGGPYSWSTSETTTVITVSPTNNTTYTVMATNAGCTNSAMVIVTVVLPPIATAVGDTVCSGETISLTSSGGGTYSWSGPNAFISVFQNPTISNPTVVNSGTYTVTVSNGTCADTAIVMTTVNPLPNTNAGSDVTIILGDSTTLTVTGGTNYIWTPITGLSCNTCSNPVATPTATTIYCVQSSLGTCINNDCVTVTIKNPCPTNKDLVVPNAFSPNADGYNDDFCLQGWNECIETFIVLIYDRWGEKVFESAEANFCWDGMYRGKMMDPAVFVYYIKATFTNDEKVVKKGNISLIR